MNLADDQQVREVLENLSKVIDARVRYEQRRDQLTSLSNDRALDEAITASIGDSRPFWVAFVEVDKFKSVNDRFGYQNADVLLQRLAETLRLAAPAFPGGATPYRAHGDEFYLLGVPPSDDPYILSSIGRELNQLRAEVSKLRVRVDRGEMSCTVSIGWACLNDIDKPTTPRATLVCLERAVGEAKALGRDRVVRYSAELVGDQHESSRGDCSACRCKFSFDVKRANNRVSQDFFCPNCGARVPRVAAPDPSPGDGGSAHTGVVRLDGDPDP